MRNFQLNFIDMKRILLSAFLLLTMCTLSAQVPQNIGGPQGYQSEVFQARKYLVAAPFPDTPNIPASLKTQMIGTIVLRMPVGGDTAYWGWIGYKWILIGDGVGGGGGGGSVSSVFGRMGAVTALEADYSSFYPLLSGTYNNPTWLNQLAWSKITGTPTTLAGYGITDPIGTVTSVSDLSPLFTTANPTTTPTFSLSNAGAYTVFGNQTAGSTTPSYAKLNVNTIDATGSPSSANFLRGDGQWVAGALSPWSYTGSNIYYNSGKVGIGVTSPLANLHIKADGLAQTVEDSSGILLTNTTPAISTVQQYPPAITFIGNGWSTPSAASFASKIRLIAMPSVDASPGSSFPSFAIQGNRTGTWVTLFSTSFAGTTLGNTNVQNLTAALVTSQTYAASRGIGSGNNIFNVFDWPTTLTNISLSHTVGGIVLRNTFNTTGGTFSYRAFSFEPTITASTGLTLIGFNNTVGNNTLNTTSGSTIVGGASGASSAKLEVQSTTTGFLPPRMTGAQAEAISSPAEGLLVYATDGSGATITSKGWWGYEGSTWVKLN